MLNKKSHSEYNKTGVSVPSLINRYDNDKLDEITQLESLALLHYAILINLKLSISAKTISRLEDDIMDLIRVRDSLKFWHKIGDENRKLRKKIIELEKIDNPHIEDFKDE